MIPDTPDLGEQALSKAAEVGLSTQLDEVENIDVQIRTDPGKLMQGELETVDIEGKGLVMVKTNNIAINPLSAAVGKIELTHATDADARVVLTEADIERAFNSEYIHRQLQNLTVNVEGQPVTINTQQVGLPGEGKITFKAKILVKETGKTKEIAFSTQPRISAGGERVRLEDVQYIEGQELSTEVTQALLQRASELLDFQTFELQGMTLRLKNLDVQKRQIILYANTHIEQFPNS